LEERRKVMSKKLAHILIVISLTLCAVFTGPSTGSAAQTAITGLDLHGAIFVSFRGACGGWYKDDDQKLRCCDLDSRPVCDDDGDCGCEIDDYCKGFCEPNGTCDEKAPDCREDQGLSKSMNLLPHGR
jgi:hypothetical protein